MLANSAASDGRTLRPAVDDYSKTGRRCTLIRASSELGVHRDGRAADTGNRCSASDAVDPDEDRPTPLQVTVSSVDPPQSLGVRARVPKNIQYLTVS